MPLAPTTQLQTADEAQPTTGVEGRDWLHQLRDAVSQLVGAKAETTLTIASGAITVTVGKHLIDTEGEAATDDLFTINGLDNGNNLRLRLVDSARHVVIKSVANGGQFFSADGNDLELTDSSQWVEMERISGTNWRELYFHRGDQKSQWRAYFGLGEAATMDKASQAEAKAGTDNLHAMTPLRTAEAIADTDLLIGARTSESMASGVMELVVKSGVNLRRVTISAIRALLRLPDYDSGEISLSTVGNDTFAHSLGTEPKQTSVYLRCKEADTGYAVGEILELGSINNGIGVSWTRNRAKSVGQCVGQYPAPGQRLFG